MSLKRKTLKSSTSLITLAIDIGGSGIKGILLDQSGQPVTDRIRIITPQPATPQLILPIISEIATNLGSFDRVSVGFPGVIHQGLVKTAPNLDPTWHGIDLIKDLEQQLNRPVRAANDADVQGYGAIKGDGVELVITLGTGFGTALFVNGHLVPNLELAHHPFTQGHTYEEVLGAAALKKIGKKKWNQRLAKAIKVLDRVINFDHLFIGGGNSKKVTLALPSHTTIVSNTAGLLGGIALWADPNISHAPMNKGPNKAMTRKYIRKLSASGEAQQT